MMTPRRDGTVCGMHCYGLCVKDNSVAGIELALSAQGLCTKSTRILVFPKATGLSCERLLSCTVSTWLTAPYATTVPN